MALAARVLLAGLATISLLLCAATVVVWAKSYSFSFYFDYHYFRWEDSSTWARDEWWLISGGGGVISM